MTVRYWVFERGGGWRVVPKHIVSDARARYVLQGSVAGTSRKMLSKNKTTIRGSSFHL